MRISDWSSDVCSSDLASSPPSQHAAVAFAPDEIAHVLATRGVGAASIRRHGRGPDRRTGETPVHGRDRIGHLEPVLLLAHHRHQIRSEEHTSELQSLMRISYVVFCLKKKNDKHSTK